MSVHEDTIQGLQEALEYIKGDTTKGRSMTITLPDDEVEADQIISRQLRKLSKENKQKVMQYAEELLQASNV